jgi:hypothetical protein
MISPIPSALIRLVVASLTDAPKRIFQTLLSRIRLSGHRFFQQASTQEQMPGGYLPPRLAHETTSMKQGSKNQLHTNDSDRIRRWVSRSVLVRFKHWSFGVLTAGAMVLETGASEPPLVQLLPFGREGVRTTAETPTDGDLTLEVVFVEFPDAIASDRSVAHFNDLWAKVSGNGELTQALRRQGFKGNLAINIRKSWKKMPEKRSYYFEGSGKWKFKKYIEDSGALLGQGPFTSNSIAIVLQDKGASTTGVGAGGHTGLNINGIRTMVTMQPDAYDASYRVLLHEIGHCFGSPDHYPISGAIHQVGGYGMMADARGARNFLGWHQFRYGWLAQNRTKFLNKKGTYTIDLKKISNSVGESMIVIPDPKVYTKLWVIEIGQDILKESDFIAGNNNYLNREGERLIVYSVEANPPSGFREVRLAFRTPPPFPAEHLTTAWLDAVSYVEGQKMAPGKAPFGLSVTSKTRDGFQIRITLPNDLNGGDYTRPQDRFSPNGEYVMRFEADGNVVIYKTTPSTERYHWDAITKGKWFKEGNSATRFFYENGIIKRLNNMTGEGAGEYKIQANVSRPSYLGVNDTGAADIFPLPAPPTLTSVSPKTGSTAGGTVVTLTGTNFTGATSVIFGGAPATKVKVVNATTITCKIPSRIVGPVNVMVTTSGGVNASNTRFTYVAPPSSQSPPTLTSVSPSTGSTAGGNVVTITGTNFTGATNVTFGGIAATSVRNVTATSITCNTPARAAGPASVLVTTPGGTNAPNTLFAYVVPSPLAALGAYLKAGNSGADDSFGYSVAVSGDTAVIGAYGEDSNANSVNGVGTNNSLSSSGAAYIYIRSFEGTWSQQAYLKASNSGMDDNFGGSVAVDGDTVVIGATREDAAYVFTRSGTTWSQQAYLKASNSKGGDIFGWSVAVSGDTAVIGAFGEDGKAPSSGAAYVFTRSGTTWSQQAYLKARNFGANDWFGYSVAVSGDTAVIGAEQESSNANSVNGDGTNNSARYSGAAYVFTRSGTRWSQQAYLKASNSGAYDKFGYSVAVSGDTAVIGAFQEDSNATTANGSNNSATNSGAAYVFTRSGTTWSQQAYLKASNSEANDNFGWSVAVSGDTAVIGAHQEDSNAIAVNGDGSNNSASDSGAAYVFTRSGTRWSQRAYLKASNSGVNDYFGWSVAVSGDNAVIGAPSEASNTITVNGNGSNNSATNSGAAYTFSGLSPAVAASPTVSAISPTSGSTAGGTSVTITGTNFTGATNVTFGGAAATNRKVVNATSITCTTPAGTAGAKGVLVTTPGGTNAANTLFTYVAPPALTSVSPNTGSTAGGTVVTLTGTNFTGATNVTFGGIAATSVRNVTATSITCNTPAGTAGAKSVLVTTPGGTNAANTLFTYVAPPTLTSVSPNTGSTAGGTVVTLTGTNFTGATNVTVGGTAATSVRNVTATSITCDTPAGAAGAKSVLVTTPGGTNAANTLFTYVAPPTLTNVSPNTGSTAGGTVVTLTGTNFTGATNVTFDGTAATSVQNVTATSITCTTPAGTAGAKSVLVTTPGGTNAANTLFTYVAPPTLTSVSPNTGSTAGGTVVTLTGTNFTGATNVTVGGTAATSVRNVTATSITCDTPAGAAGAKSVLVTTPGGTNAANTLFTYVAPPTLTNVSPNTGSTAGGTVVTLTGTNFTGATNVTFDGTAATSVRNVTATSITCDTPAGTAGAKSVLVTTTGGTNAANTLFTYVAPPTLTSVSPNTGSTAGGTVVTLTGTNFTGATSVTVGGTAATSVQNVTATSITCNTPAGTAGAKSVLVTTPGGTNAANTLFTYVAPPTLVFNFVETGGAVTMTYSGTLDTNGMTPQPDTPHQHNGTFIFDIPERDVIGIAGTNSNTNSYLWTTNPLNFIVREAGQGFVFFTPNPGSTPFMNSARNAAGVSLESEDIDANGIWSGSGGATLSGPDFATLGLVPGRHFYTDAVSGQSVVFNIGDVAPLSFQPEPSLSFQPEPFRVTAFTYNRTARTVDLTFTSEFSVNYTIEASPNLQLQSWSPLPGGPVIGSAGITTVTGLALPFPVTDKMFLRVRRDLP